MYAMAVDSRALTSKSHRLGDHYCHEVVSKRVTVDKDLSDDWAERIRILDLRMWTSSAIAVPSSDSPLMVRCYTWALLHTPGSHLFQSDILALT